MRWPLSVTDDFAPEIRFTVTRLKSVNTRSTAWSAVAFVGSMRSIVPESESIESGREITHPEQSHRTESGTPSLSSSVTGVGLFAGMHCVAVLEPAGADALTGADATAPFEPSIVAVAISPATSPSTVFARLSAWTWDMMGVAGGGLSFF